MQILVNRVRQSALLEVPAAKAYGVVADIERYPEFLPGCEKVVLLTADSDRVTAQVQVSGAGQRVTFVTENRLEDRRIGVSLREGPFRKLEGLWQFTPIGDLGCRVEIDVTYELETLLGVVFKPFADVVTAKVVDAFIARVEQAATDGG